MIKLPKCRFSNSVLRPETKGRGNLSRRRRVEQKVKGVYEKEKRTRTFLTKWRDDFKWMEYDADSNVMFCAPCRKFDGERRFVTGTNNFRIDALKHHEESSNHVSCQLKYDMQVMKEKM